MREVTEKYEAGEEVGAEANITELLAAAASWFAAAMRLQTRDGVDFAEEYDVKHKFGETGLYQEASISTNMNLSYIAKHALGLPRSY